MSRADDRELRSASTRLAIQFAALILVMFAVLGAVVVAIVSAGQSEAAQRALMDASMVDSPHDVHPPAFVTIVGPDGRSQSSRDLPTGLPDEQAIERVSSSGVAEQTTTRLDGDTYLVRTSSHDGRVSQVAYDLGEQQDELGRLITALVISGVVAAAAAALIGVFIARRAMRPLADALAMQRRFVADASHELRTPLTLLSTRAQLVRRRLRDADGADDVQAVTEGIDEIVGDSKALTEIVEDLLVAADPREAGIREQVDLREISEEAAATIRPKAAEGGVTVTVTDGEPVVVTGAPISLRRLVLAMLDNAVEYAAGVVEVSVAREGKTAVLRVQDDGPGFPAETATRAFDRFASARESSERAGDGAPAASRHYGLGLALVAEVATRHGGSVAARNAGPGGGASVEVRLPVATR
ncbi:sensor histidine kinase [Leifsonia sp. NPDC058248]|uniref:sensor histidine kinase n=1 Tax=Leifsonia sp. NPDC058248 TaxID=3346402 RepID=UPI0036DEC80D